jgi:uroporphyrinogen-III synthase
LFPKADGARDLIPQQLRARGAQVVDPVVYRNVMPQALPDDARQALKQHQVDAVVFSSPSTVRNFAALAGGAEQLLGMLDNVVVASIGPVTSKACREWGLHVTVEPEHATLDDLVVELERYFGTS